MKACAALPVKRLWYLSLFAFLLGAPLRVAYDVSNPQEDWLHHPAWGVPIAAVVIATAGLFLWAWREDRRRARLTARPAIEEDLRLLRSRRPQHQ